jgi:hypothetical protein
VKHEKATSDAKEIFKSAIREADTTDKYHAEVEAHVKCRRYALEAIIKLLFISMFIIMFMFHAITAMVLESTITTRLGGRLICTCGIINDKMYS